MCLDVFTHRLMHNSHQLEMHNYVILNIKHWILIFKLILKMKIDFKCEIKTTSRWQWVTVNKWVTASEPNHLNDWFIQERITVMLLRDTKQCCSCVWSYFFVGEIEQKQAIWRLKRTSLNINILFIELLYKINNHICNHAYFWRKNGMKHKYTHFLPPYLEFCDHS